MAVMPLAQLGFPPGDVSAAAFKGVKAQFGVPPPGFLRDGEVIDYLLDGTFTPGTNCSDKDRQALFKGNKGVGYNNILAFSYSGVIIDGSFAHPGSVHDAKACKSMMQRFQDASYNHAGVSALVDTGLCGYCNDNHTPGHNNVWRPMKSEYYGKIDPKIADRFSAKMTTYRQPNEWGNGQFKRSFPRLAKKIGTDPTSQRQLARDFLTCARIFNLRTRMVSLNQLKTTFMAHVDSNFAKQLDGTTDFDEYCCLAAARPHMDAYVF